MENLIVRKVAVLGAGVMGAQIAAHLVNVQVPVILFDLAAPQGAKNAIVDKAIDGLTRLSPAPFALPGLTGLIEAANYEEDLGRLAECDLVIEAIAERMEWKLDLYRKIGPHLRADSIIASNTSGLSINTIGATLPQALHSRFCGIHFFNPPRYMTLVELIPTTHSDPALLDSLETFLVSTVGKGVIRANDTPNFIANRYGIFSMLATMEMVQRYDIGFDVADDLTGLRLGRAKSATFRTADVVGLDTMHNVTRTMADTLGDDPWHRYFQTPAWMRSLIDKGSLGQKTRAGIYSKVGKDILVLDRHSGEYAAATGGASEAVKAILKIRPAPARFAALRASADPHAQFLWAIQRELFHYCAYHLATVANNARDVDLALRWGFGWSSGPFETWQAAGWQQVAGWIAEDIDSGQTLSSAPLPDWVTEGARRSVHAAAGSYSAASGTLIARSALPVYQRQSFPPRVMGERAARTGTTVFENAGVRLWTGIRATQSDVAVVSFRSKASIINQAVIQGLQQAVAMAEQRFAGLVIWPADDRFSTGADLAMLCSLIEKGEFSAIESLVTHFQQTLQQVRDAHLPVVAAVQGMALGGGCELILHCARVVASLESQIGLVETSIGLIPAGGGCKALALRAAHHARAGGSVIEAIQPRFGQILKGVVSRSAAEARGLGYLNDADIVIANPFELLHVAASTARSLRDSGWRAPLAEQNLLVAGSAGIAVLAEQLGTLREGAGFSEHDQAIGMALAQTLCGGDVAAGSVVTENQLFDLEREHFMALMRQPLTQARINAMLTTGKALRN